MAYTIPFEEPEIFAAGDRVQWKRTLSTYPISEGWTLKYYLRGNVPLGTFDITAVTSGTDYEVDLSPTTTAEYTPGDYYWQSYVEKSGDRKPIGSGKFVVLTNPTDIQAPYDGRTHARRVLDSLNLLIEGRATQDVNRYVMQAVGRSVDKIPISDLIKLRDYYLNEVKREESVAAGGRNRNVFVQFNG